MSALSAGAAADASAVGAPPALRGGGTASMKVGAARSGEVGELPLGLDRPLDLLGADALEPDVIGIRLDLDWQHGLMRMVDAACIAQRRGGRPWFAIPPVALIGPEGAGRDHAARGVAHAAGLPHLTLDVSGACGARRVAGRLGRGEPPEPSMSAIAMAASRCANPVISVVGLTGAVDEALSALMELVDPSTAGCARQAWFPGGLDFSRVNWIFHAPVKAWSGARFAAVLEPVELRKPCGRDECELRAASVVRAALRCRGMTPCGLHGDLQALHEALSGVWERAPLSDLWIRAEAELDRIAGPPP